jgi:serine/threonine-protein kinase
MKQENQHFNSELFTQLLSNELAADQQLAVESHLENCSHCQRQLESLVAGHDEWDKARQHLTDSNELKPGDWMINQQTVSVMLTPDGNAFENRPGSVGESTTFYEQLALDAPTHPEMLGRIDGFEIEKVIGRGGCGVVYKGFDRELHRPVAIKVLAPQLASNGIARQRFAREARAAAAVVHPNVVPIHSVSPGPERPYIVMSLVNGRSLEAHVREHGPLELKDIVRIAQQIAAGLAAAHRQGLIHRDIKPANILLEQDVSRVMITDFGLARASDDAAITQTGWLAGTPHYMSPEQARGVDIDQRSDLFSLGSVIYFMATGREPFRAEKPFAVIQKIIAEKPARPRQVNSDISKTLEQIIERLLSKHPRNRFQSAEEVQQALEKYLAHLQNPLTSPAPRGILARRRKLTPAFLGVCAALLLAASGWFAYTAGGLPIFTGKAQPSPAKVFFDSPATTASPLESGIDFMNATDNLSDDDFEMQLELLNEEISRMEADLNDVDPDLLNDSANPRERIFLNRTTVDQVELSPAEAEKVPTPLQLRGQDERP